MRIVVKSDIAQATKALTSIERKQVPFAVSKAVNNAAFITRKDLQSDIKRIFHKPRPWVVRGVRVHGRKATKRQPTRTVYIEEFPPGASPYDVLRPHIVGGKRTLKRSERALIRKGVIRRFMVPAMGYRSRATGDITQGKMQQIMSAVGAFSEVGYIANRSARSSKRRGRKQKQYFAIRHGQRSHLKPGVYERVNRRRVKPALVQIRSPHYNKRFPFEKLALRHARRAFRSEFPKALRDALATARP